jgi:MFS transporter, DHA1 family, multidrug resistance protein
MERWKDIQLLSSVSTHIDQYTSGLLHLLQAARRKNLPKFGGGKPYPPALPTQEEYVVEFDGHDDPSHAQN